MRPFPHDCRWIFCLSPLETTVFEVFLFVGLVMIGAWLCGCAATGAGFVTPALPATPMPPAPVSVTVTPPSVSVILGNSQLFVAKVTNASETAVTWTVNGIGGGNVALGSISPAGWYTAPAVLPITPGLEIAATSIADPTKIGAAAADIASDLQIVLSASSAAVELGATRSLLASVISAGHPDTDIRWTLTGPTCPVSCGAVDATGIFSAPQILPSPAIATLTAQSVADPSKRAATSLTITSSFALRLTGPPTVFAGASTGILATFTPAPGSSPSQTLAWSVTGAGCSGAACGVLDVLTAPSAGASSNAGSTTYSSIYWAPPSTPNPNAVTISATPLADPSKRALLTLMVLPIGGVIVSPPAATVAANHRVTLTVQVPGTASPNVTWTVDGIPGGNPTLGQICATLENPCVPVTSATAAKVDYLAPGTIPSPDPVTVQATSTADATKIATSQITVLNHLVVSVQPANATLAPLATQGFAATVTGATNQSVVWQLRGPACAAAACGSVTADGVYSAPAAAPSPNAIQVVATSADDSSQSNAANVTISTGANILALHPASIYAGAADGFILRVDGSGFAASSPGPGASLLIAGVPRAAACDTTTQCTVPITAADVSAPGIVTLQLQNPDGTRSNGVSLVVTPPNVSDGLIALTSVIPSVVGQDIVVVEPSTAGVSLSGDDVDLNLAAIGSFSTADNSCGLTGNPVALHRPASGTAVADVCMFSESGLDASMTFVVSGPGDVAVIAAQPLGLGIVRISLQIPASSVPGPRTLFVQNTNLDKAAASGALEVN
jgi:hypothetical protein